MLLNELGISVPARLKSINKFLMSNYGVSLSSDASVETLTSIKETIQQDINALKYDNKTPRDPIYSKKLVMLEGVNILISEAQHQERAHTIYRKVVSNLANAAIELINIGDEVEPSIQKVMDEYRSSKYRFPDLEVERDIRNRVTEFLNSMEEACVIDDIESGHKLLTEEDVIIQDYEIINHGVQQSGYFQGCGSGDYEQCVTGVGYSEKSALEDALEQVAQMGYEVSPELEAESNKASDEDEVQKELTSNMSPVEFDVSHFSRSMGSTIYDDSFDTMQDAVDAVNDLINSLQSRGFDVDQIGENTWEVTEADDAVMVPEESGIISIKSNEQEIESELQKRQEYSNAGYYVSIRFNV